MNKLELQNQFALKKFLMKLLKSRFVANANRQK